MATSIHVRGNGVGSTLLRKKADPAHDWVDNLPAVAEGETVRVIETEGAFSLVRLASGEQGFIWSKYLRAAGAPVKLNEVLKIPALNIRADAITFANCTMESEKFITVREQAGEQVMIHMINLMNPSQTEKRPITADAALMNPVAKILALRSGENLQVGRTSVGVKVYTLILTHSFV